MWRVNPPGRKTLKVLMYRKRCPSELGPIIHESRLVEFGQMLKTCDLFNFLSLVFCFNCSQLAKMKKIDSLYVTAMKLVGKKRCSWSHKIPITIYLKNYNFCEFVKFGAIFLTRWFSNQTSRLIRPKKINCLIVHV